jgi:type I restriction enzyme, S subunit
MGNIASLAEITNLITDGKHGDCADEFDSGYYFISAKDVRDAKINYEGARQITKIDFEDTHRRTRLEPDDILITNSGTIGRMAIVQEGEKTRRTTFQKSVAIIKPKKHLVEPRFLYYTFLTQVGYLIELSGGTAQKNLLLGDLRRFKLRVPPVSVQKKIAAILAAYDELIENNQQRIALLERMAEEIYREWFVRLRFPGHEQVKFVKGVPEGWEVKQFHEIVEYYIGGGWGEDDQSTTFSEAAFVIRGTDIPDIQTGEFEGCPYRFHKPSNLKSRTLQPGDFVFEVSGGSKDQLLGRNVFITERLLKYFNAPVIAASFCKQIRFSRELISPYFMKYFMKLYYDYDLVGIYQIQSTGISNYQFESFLKYQTIVLPPDELQKKFEDIVKPIIEMRDGISLANIELRKTRDLLLPRIISGKLSVENLDIQFPPSMAEEQF